MTRPLLARPREWGATTKWTPDHDIMLGNLRAEGVQYAEIAKRMTEHFGMPFTETACSGRAKRAGLTTGNPTFWTPQLDRIIVEGVRSGATRPEITRRLAAAGCRVVSLGMTQRLGVLRSNGILTAADPDPPHSHRIVAKDHDPEGVIIARRQAAAEQLRVASLLFGINPEKHAPRLELAIAQAAYDWTTATGWPPK